MLFKCCNCKLDKPADEFANRKDGKKIICKECNSARCKAWREAHPDYWKKQTATAIGPEFYERRKRRIVKNHVHFLKELFRGTTRDRRRAFTHTITLDYLVALWEQQQGKCAITNLVMLYERRNPKSVSIDRIDSTKGYVVGNVQLVCRFINLAKQQYSNEVICEILDEYHELRLGRPGCQSSLEALS